MSEAKSEAEGGDRERSTATLGTKVAQDKFDDFQEAAEENGHSKSSQLRELVDIFLEVHEDNE